MLQFQLLPFTELRTPRLVLRRITLADAPTILFLRSDPTITRYLDREPAADLAEAEEFVGLVEAGLTENRGITWALAPAGEEHRMLGTCGLWRLDAEHHRGEIGYTLHPDAWGQGLMSEALAAVCRYGFEQLHLHSIEGNVNPQNAASIKLLERQGFVREAYFRENYHFRGQFLDSAIYSLLAPRSAE